MKSISRTINFLIKPKAHLHTTSISLLAVVTEVVPALGESITEGTIANWTKSVGEKIEIDDVVAIVETDKVTVDIKSSLSGILTKQLADETVFVNIFFSPCYFLFHFVYFLFAKLMKRLLWDSPCMRSIQME
jgi:hypothetical protein